MTVVYWIAVSALIAFIVLSRINIAKEDTWGDRLLPWARFTGVVTVLAGVVFTVWFGLDSFGIHITVGG